MESTVSVGVAGVLMISLYAALTSGFNSVQWSREDARATQILVRRMDQLRLFAWDQVTNGTSIPTTFFEAYNPQAATPTNNMTSGNGNGNGNGNAGGMGMATLMASKKSSLLFTAARLISPPSPSPLRRMLRT